MDTFLYIVVAIGIMAYQIYNEKNKKEQRANTASRPPVNRPPVKRVDPNEELNRDLAQMFGSLSAVNGLEDEDEDELDQEQYIASEQEYKNASHQYQSVDSQQNRGLASQYQGLASQNHRLASQNQGLSSQNRGLASEYHGLASEYHGLASDSRSIESQLYDVPLQARRKYEPEIVPTETLGAEAYNVDVPVNKTDAETTQLLLDIYDSSEISGHDSDGNSQKKSDLKVKSFDPRLFILYSEIARPKYLD